jgi:hypothetical protein
LVIYSDSSAIFAHCSDQPVGVAATGCVSQEYFPANQPRTLKRRLGQDIYCPCCLGVGTHIRRREPGALMTLETPAGAVVQPCGERTAVVVLGCHRSGTSALAGTLGLLGGILPNRLMPPAASNSRGHFEPQDIASLHDEVLASAGSTWQDWSEFPPDWYASSACDRYVRALADAFHSNYGDSFPAVVKDPRMNRLMPLWELVFARLQVSPVIIVSIRNPLEVAESLEHRDEKLLLEGLLIWLRNQLEAEAATRHLPRVFVSYDSLLANWRVAVAQIEANLGIVLPRRTASAHNDVDDFLTSTLRHHHRNAPSVTGVDIADWAAEAYRLLLPITPGVKPPSGELDALRSRLNQFTHTCAPLADHYARRLSWLGNQKDVAATDLARVTEENRQQAARLVETEHRLAAEGAHRAAAEQHIAAAEQRIAQAETRAVEAETKGAEAETRVAAAETRATEAETRIAEAQARAAQAEAKAARVELCATAEIARRESAEAAVAVQEARVAELQDLNEAIMRSTSWQVTRPLRSVGRCIYAMGSFSRRGLRRRQTIGTP